MLNYLWPHFYFHWSQIDAFVKHKITVTDTPVMSKCYKTFQTLTLISHTCLMGGLQILHGCQQSVHHTLNSTAMDFTATTKNHTRKGLAIFFYKSEKKENFKKWYQVQI